MPSCLIIDNEGDSRNRVKHAVSECGKYESIDVVSTLDEGFRKMALDSYYTVVLISDRYPDQDITGFIRRCKDIKAGEDATYIAILKSNEQSQAKLRLKYALGVDAFLLEPYSPQMLADIIALSIEIRQERQEIRDKIALSLVIIDVISQLNLLAALLQCGFSTRRTMQQLQDLCRPLKDMGGPALDIYFDLLTHLFIAAPTPMQINPDEYHRGITDRVRERMERRLIKDLEEQRLAGESPLQELKEVILEEQSARKVRVISR